MVTKEDLSALMMLFAQGITSDEVLILEGQPFDADVACQQIYGRTKKIILVSHPGTAGDTDTTRLSCGGTDVPQTNIMAFAAVTDPKTNDNRKKDRHYISGI
ncbi:MAG: hypothetical protein IJT77_14055 [Clostridia bacterium]|nr:hypothetical protein [Clostridia bacterium]